MLFNIKFCDATSRRKFFEPDKHVKRLYENMNDIFKTVKR